MPKLQVTIVNTFFDAVLVSDGEKMEIAEICAAGAYMDFSVSHRRSSQTQFRMCVMEIVHVQRKSHISLQEGTIFKGKNKLSTLT